jgi:hypothetical protein
LIAVAPIWSEIDPFLLALGLPQKGYERMPCGIRNPAYALISAGMLFVGHAVKTVLAQSASPRWHWQRLPSHLSLGCRRRGFRRRRLPRPDLHPPSHPVRAPGSGWAHTARTAASTALIPRARVRADAGLETSPAASPSGRYLAHCAQPLLPSHRQDALSRWRIVAECCNLGTTNLSAAGPLPEVLCEGSAGRVSTERGTRNGNARETQNSAFRIAFRERIPGTPTRNRDPSPVRDHLSPRRDDIQIAFREWGSLFFALRCRVELPVFCTISFQKGRFRWYCNRKSVLVRDFSSK